MKKLIITENDKEYIKSLYGILNEQKTPQVSNDPGLIRKMILSDNYHYKMAYSKTNETDEKKAEEAKQLSLKKLVEELNSTENTYNQSGVCYIITKVDNSSIYKSVAYIHKDSIDGVNHGCFDENAPKATSVNQKLNAREKLDELSKLGYKFDRYQSPCGGEYIEGISFGGSLYFGSIGVPSNKPKDTITPYSLDIQGPCGKFNFRMTIEETSYIGSTPEYIQELKDYWNNLGYNLDNLSSISNDNNNFEKFKNDLKSFFQKYPPETKGIDNRKPKLNFQIKN